MPEPSHFQSIEASNSKSSMTASKDPQVEAVPVSQCQPDEKDRPSPAEVGGHTSGRKVNTEERKIEQEKEPDAPEPDKSDSSHASSHAVVLEWLEFNNDPAVFDKLFKAYCLEVEKACGPESKYGEISREEQVAAFERAGINNWVIRSDLERERLGYCSEEEENDG